MRIAASYLLLQLIPLSSAASVTSALQTWPTWMLWLGVFFSGVWLYLNFSGYQRRLHRRLDVAGSRRRRRTSIAPTRPRT